MFFQLTTMLTRRPPATTTFFTVLPWRCFTTCGSAMTSSRTRSSAKIGRHRNPCAELPVDLDRHGDLLGLGDRLVEFGPARLDDTAGVTEHLPEFFRHVRRERAKSS